ncbi:twin-arginine translocation signal domain-containing protein, partial [Nonomuraea angiospora]
MVSRRRFLRANGVVLAAGGLGLTFQGPAAARALPT